MPYGTVNAEQMTTQSGFTLGAGDASSFKNRIINGGMVVNQYARGTFNVSTGGAASNDYSADRFPFYKDQSGATIAGSNSSTAPTGFTNSVLWSVTTGASAGSTDQCFIAQQIEGYNWADLAWGTANAKPVIFSFWVNTSVTGTYGVSFSNSAATQTFVGTYTVNAANTWEQKTIAITGSTSGTWLTTNGIGLRIRFDMGSGTTFETATPNTWQGSYDSTVSGRANLTGTTGATFYLTGVQMEVGTVATSFDWRPYTTELSLCQRYFQTWGGTANFERIAVGYAVSSTQAEVYVPRFPVPMRAAPSLAVNSVSNFRISDALGSTVLTAAAISQSALNSCGIQVTVASGLTTYRSMSMDTNNTTSALLSLSSEI